MRVSLIPIFVLSLAACDRSPQQVADPVDRPVAFGGSEMTQGTIKPSAAETDVINKLLAMVPPEHRPKFREILLTPGLSPHARNNPAANQLLDELANIRRLQAPAEPAVAPAVVALVESFPGGRLGKAMVVRRKEFGDFILLPDKGATPEAFGAAIVLLTRQRKKTGVVPSKNESFTVESVSGFPKGWKSDVIADAKKQLDDLSKKDKAKVRGVGQARSTEILMRVR